MSPSCFVDVTTEEIHTIYVSGDESRLRKLNASRRTAGEKTISALIDSIDGDALRERAETLRHGMKFTVSLPSANQAYLNMVSYLLRQPTQNGARLRESDLRGGSPITGSAFR
ncbi:hypothetical protein E4U21_001194 [Claviceps maximensis]|nr:hypothetical protein E4U21_001194 [Claviceps maximensis]